MAISQRLLAGWAAVVVFCAWAAPAMGQSDTTVISLPEISVKAPIWEKYTAGSKRLTLDSAETALYQATTLQELLHQRTALYLREYGSGMLSSLSFRGTSASHTAVLWNGININSFTLGSSDFSYLPVAASDRISLQYGSASSLYGSDAIGGSVHLHTDLPVGQQLSLGAQQTLGSFGQYSAQAYTRYGGKRWAGYSQVYYHQAQNDFPFENTAKQGRPRERQTNAAYEYYGMRQTLSYRPREGRTLSMRSWYHHNYRQIQPDMSVQNTGEVLQDQSLRLMLEWDEDQAWGRLLVRAAWVADEQVYNRNSTIAVNRGIGSAEYERPLGQDWILKLGGTWNHITALVRNYGDVVTEQRQDAFASLRWQTTPRIAMSLNVRQAWVTGFEAPIAPSLGLEARLWEYNAHYLGLKLLGSRNYRVPTLNDRYWIPGGNPELRSELGWSAEGGLVYAFQPSEGWRLEADVQLYKMWVQDWIAWVPLAAFWAPVNIQEVHSQGLEAGLNLQRQHSAGWHWQLGLQYALTQAINQRAQGAFDRSAGKQLPYTPEHRAVFLSQLQYKSFFAQANYGYTGFRFTTSDNSQFLNDFWLLNLALGTRLPQGASAWQLSLRLNNLLSTSYQNMAFRAMPGRNFQLSLRYDWQRR
ncbi:TonB-dependent receptor plug domain-containing protein [Eisenibacter elegans]|jgi:iron complex outermembrane receptor protein|uniref:TonB-dependent receptor plug domain-containing protein n=1 Tax=Eisenibacter elegans TaxID=997 RepID=UPI00042745B8|nr:TonB-dependent receptor plug domain-containing protein [Eisenibacter elegans]